MEESEVDVERFEYERSDGSSVSKLSFYGSLELIESFVVWRVLVDLLLDML